MDDLGSYIQTLEQKIQTVPPQDNDGRITPMSTDKMFDTFEKKQASKNKKSSKKKVKNIPPNIMKDIQKKLKDTYGKNLNGDNKAKNKMTIREKEATILDLEHQISELIRSGRSSCHASFRYTPQGPKVRCKLVTWNPQHKTTFLVREIESFSRIEALNQLLVYVKDKIRDAEKPYTVKWHLRNSQSTKLVTSHFYAEDVYSLLDKFYYDKNRNDYEIIEIKLNPST